jgi:hypothetical protein
MMFVYLHLVRAHFSTYIKAGQLHLVPIIYRALPMPTCRWISNSAQRVFAFASSNARPRLPLWNDEKKKKKCRAAASHSRMARHAILWYISNTHMVLKIKIKVRMHSTSWKCNKNERCSKLASLGVAQTCTLNITCCSPHKGRGYVPILHKIRLALYLAQLIKWLSFDFGSLST